MDPRPSATAEDGTIELVPIPPEVWPTPATDAPAGLEETVAAWLPDALAPARLAFLVEAGGPVVVVLVAMSLVAATVVIAKLLQFRAHQLAAEAPVLAAAAALRRGDADGARARLAASRHPAARLVALAAACAETDRAGLESELGRIGRRQLAALRAHFRILEVVASLAPLLGLFGTVLGMIAAFRALEAAGGAVDPAVLSGGIWQALSTTAVGLAVAMPTVAALAFLERRVERVAETMDDVVVQLLAPLPATAAAASSGRLDHAAG